LPLDVADQHPEAVPRHGHVVEVAADQGILAGRQVAHGQPDPAHPRRDRAQDRPLGDLSDPGDTHQRLLLPGATVSDEDAQRPCGRHPKAAQQVVGGAKDPIWDAQQDRNGDRVQAHDPGGSGVEGGRGQQRTGDQQVEQDRAVAGPGVQQRDDGGDQYRDKHRPGLGLHRTSNYARNAAGGVKAG